VGARGATAPARGRAILAAALLVLAVTGCTSTTGDANPTEDLGSVDSCSSELQTLLRGIVVYYDTAGRYPRSQAEMIEIGALDTPSSRFDVKPGTGKVVAVKRADGTSRCKVPKVARDRTTTTAVPTNPARCRAEAAAVRKAADEFYARTGNFPRTTRQLVDEKLLPARPELYDLVPDSNAPVVSDDGRDEGCIPET
jgi:hypothetical protein